MKNEEKKGWSTIERILELNWEVKEPEMSVPFVIKHAIEGKIVWRLKKKKKGKKIKAVNMACDTNYSLSIMLMTYMASSNKWVLDTRATSFVFL